MEARVFLSHQQAIKKHPKTSDTLFNVNSKNVNVKTFDFCFPPLHRTTFTTGSKVQKSTKREGPYIEGAKTTTLLSNQVDKDQLQHGVSKLVKANIVKTSELKAAKTALSNICDVNRNEKRKRKRDIFDD